MNDFLKRLLNYQQQQQTNWNSEEAEKKAAGSAAANAKAEAAKTTADPEAVSVRWPVKKPVITSKYGPRTLVADGKKIPGYHYGIDLVGDYGVIYAPETMIIKKYLAPDKKYPCKFRKNVKNGQYEKVAPPKGKTWADTSWAWTPYIVAVGEKTGNMYIFRHVDMRDNVKIGDTVKVGTEFAVYGNLGYSMGAHLHFEIMPLQDGKWPKTVDPLKVLEAKK
jgi:murein DD-endopeptidase MepM/ murein hydrolase activator NlpD